MKKILSLVLLSIIFSSCSNDDDEKYCWKFVRTDENIADCGYVEVSIQCDITEKEVKEKMNALNDMYRKIYESNVSLGNEACLIVFSYKKINPEKSWILYQNYGTKNCKLSNYPEFEYNMTEEEVKKHVNEVNKTIENQYKNGEIDCLATIAYKRLVNKE